MLRSTRLDVSKAERLMLIARHPVLSNSAHWADLPPSWRTLYELTHLCRPGQSPQRMLDLIRSGEINAFMTREDAQALLTGRKQDAGEQILSADLARVIRLLDQLTIEQAIDNLRSDPGNHTPASLSQLGRKLLTLAKQWRATD